MATQRTRSVPIDVAFDLLSASPRRRLLYELHVETTGADEWLQLSSCELGEDASPLALRHRHLPKLERANMIETNDEGNAVCRGQEFESIEPVLDVLDGARDDLPLDSP